MRLLRKVFDSLNKLELRDDSQGKSTKFAFASNKLNRMEKFFKSLLQVFSDDGERVSFFNDLNLDGAVEIWLSRLLDFHCETIRNWLRVAVNAYEVR